MARFNIIYFLGIFNVLAMINKFEAFEFRVGGSKGTWEVPADPNSSEYNKWAERNRFQVGDSLLFVYAADQDSVMQVTKDDYTNCKTAKPTAKYSDGHTVIKFDRSGPYYFISGVDDNCHKNEKLVVVVMADRSKHSTPPPSPAPSGEESPSPPSDEETNPTAAPSQEASPPNNGVSSIVHGAVGTIGVALLGSSLVMFSLSV